MDIAEQWSKDVGVEYAVIKCETVTKGIAKEDYVPIKQTGRNGN